ncbi:MAG TPA: heme-binding protein [Chloroflexota bacterium]
MIITESIGIDEARRAIEGILAAVTEQDSPVAIAIVDAHGDLVCSLRADGAAARMGRRSRAKAYTAAVLGMDTVIFRDQVVKAQGRTLGDWGDPQLTSLQGGLVVKRGDQVLGGIAMSGNNTARDEELAGIGLKAMGIISPERPGGQQMNGEQSIDLAAARRAVAAAVGAVEPGDKPIAVVVADDNGEPIYAERMDGASVNDMRQAERKAYSAAFMARDTRGYRDQIAQDGRTLADWSDPMLTTLTGGVTIGERRAVIGAVGVHGNTAVRDEQLARAGVEAALRPSRQTALAASPVRQTPTPAAPVRTNDAATEGRNGSGGRERGASMTQRKAFNLPRLAPAGAVAPDLVQVGNLFFTSGIRGVDLATGKLAESPDEQFTLAWRNLRSLVEGAGLSLDNVGLVTNFLDSQEYRAYINPGWLELWPNDNRPARKTTSYPLPAGEAVELQAYGVVGSRRDIIQVEGLAHRDPLPNGVRIGDYVFSSVLVPQDLRTAKTVEGPEAQTDQCFDNMRVFMEKAGGGIQDVVLQWVYLNDFNYQKYMVDVYLKAWPIGGYQAARKTFRYPMNGQIQIQVIGRIGGARSNHEIEGHGHHDPIPMGAKIGDLFASSGVSGVDPSSGDRLTSAEGVEAQSKFGLGNIEGLVKAGGGTLDNIGHMTLLVQDYAELPVIDAAWERVFPDSNDRPARQIMKLGAQGGSHVQFHMLASI